MNVFVYGSLKKGYWNNAILRESEFLFNATTIDSNYDMIDLGSFPAVVKGKSSKISGEVYRVNKRTLEMLDALEGNGSFYNREETLVESSDGIRLKVWIYIYQERHRDMGFYTRKANIYILNNSKSWKAVI